MPKQVVKIAGGFLEFVNNGDVYSAFFVTRFGFRKHVGICWKSGANYIEEYRGERGVVLNVDDWKNRIVRRAEMELSR